MASRPTLYTPKGSNCNLARQITLILSDEEGVAWSDRNSGSIITIDASSSSSMQKQVHEASAVYWLRNRWDRACASKSGRKGNQWLTANEIAKEPWSQLWHSQPVETNPGRGLIDVPNLFGGPPCGSQEIIIPNSPWIILTVNILKQEINM